MCELQAGGTDFVSNRLISKKQNNFNFGSLKDNLHVLVLLQLLRTTLSIGTDLRKLSTNCRRIAEALPTQSAELCTKFSYYYMLQNQCIN